MKKILCCFFWVVFLLPSELAGQTVVVNDNIQFAFIPGGSLDEDSENHVGTVSQDIIGDDHTSVWFYFDGNELSYRTENIDGGSDWYLVHPGDEFGYTTLENDQFSQIFHGNNEPIGLDDFYLGVSTEGVGPFNNCDPHSEVCRNVFGWVRLRNVLGRLEMVENAVAYNSLGIIVGTTEVVPEPPGLFLGWLAFVGLTMCKRLGSRRSCC